VYIGCHCFRNSRPQQIIEVNAATGQKLRDLGGSLAGGDSAWAFTKAPDGCLWAGGDFRNTTQLVGRSGTQWVGRFARMCDAAGPLPHNVPSLTPPPDPDAIIASGDDWRYLATGAHPQGWTQPGFDDGGWTVGSSELGYGDGDEDTVIPQAGRSALFRRTFSADPAQIAGLELGLNIDDGATVWINGQPVVAENMRPGVVDASTWAASGVWGAQESDFTSYHLDPGVLVAGNNTIAVSVHQSDSTSRDLTFDRTRSRSGGAENAPAPPDIDTPGLPAAAPEELVAAGSTWRYLDDGVGPEAGWRDLAFGDDAWGQGPAPLGYGDGDEATVTRPSGRAPTAWFRHRFTVDDPSRFTELVLGLVRDDGAVVHLNGAEVVRDNVPATDFVTGPGESRFEQFVIPAGALRAGENVLAVEIHQAPQSVDLSFDLSLQGR
jgi:hypothetical protein